MRNLLQAFRCHYNFTKVVKAEGLVDHYKGYKNVTVNLTEEELLNVSKPYFPISMNFESPLKSNSGVTSRLSSSTKGCLHYFH
jgi:hypothetical protein